MFLNYNQLTTPNPQENIMFKIMIHDCCFNMVAQGKWIYDMDPFQPLRWEKPLMKLKERIAKEGSKAVFSPLMEKYILNNPHRVTVEMQVSNPSPSRHI